LSKVSEYTDSISGYLNESRFEELKEFLKANSNLPGPRGNLEMAYAFADCFAGDIDDVSWAFVIGLSNIDSEQAPVNDPGEILPFCAALAAGSQYYRADEARKAQIRTILKAAMNDERWRMCEGAAMGYQRMAERDFKAVKGIFDSLYPKSIFLEKRAIIAALAHPPILKEKDIAQYSLKVSEDIMDGILTLNTEELKSDGFKVLSKGFEYALSVFVAYAPDEGFEMLRRFATAPQKDIKRIIRSNLGKARLTKEHPQEVDEVMRMLEA
jgi:hypothetical protein